MTLIEVLVAMFCLTLLAGVALAVFQRSGLLLEKSFEKSSLTRQLNIATKRLEKSFLSFGSRERQISEDKTECTHRTALNSGRLFMTTPKGYPHWQARLRYSLVDDQLVELRLPLSPTDRAEKPVERRVICASVESMQWSEVTSDTVQLVLSLKGERDRLKTVFRLTAGQGDAL